MLAQPNTAIAEPAEYIETPEIYTDFSILNGEEYPTEVLCNCYKYVKKVLPDTPNTFTILSNVKNSVGDIVIFYYPESNLHHYAIVEKIYNGHVYISETNYSSCSFGRRIVPLQDSTIVGYY